MLFSNTLNLRSSRFIYIFYYLYILFLFINVCKLHAISDIFIAYTNILELKVKDLLYSEQPLESKM